MLDMRAQKLQPSKDLKKALHILRKGKVKVDKNVIDILEEVGSTLEDEYEGTKMNFEVYVPFLPPHYHRIH